MTQRVDIEIIQKNQARKEEIMGFLTDLSSFEMNIDDVVRSSPSKWQIREKAKKVAQLVLGNPELKEHLYEHGDLPVEKIQAEMKIDRRFLVANENYIKALVLILASEGMLLKEYIRPWGGEGK